VRTGKAAAGQPSGRVGWHTKLGSCMRLDMHAHTSTHTHAHAHPRIQGVAPPAPTESDIQNGGQDQQEGSGLAKRRAAALQAALLEAKVGS